MGFMSRVPRPTRTNKIFLQNLSAHTRKCRIHVNSCQNGFDRVGRNTFRNQMYLARCPFEQHVRARLRSAVRGFVFILKVEKLK